MNAIFSIDFSIKNISWVCSWAERGRVKSETTKVVHYNVGYSKSYGPWCSSCIFGFFTGCLLTHARGWR